MLVDFVSPRGKLFVPDTPKTIGPLRSLLGKARAAGAPIIYIQDWHRPDDPEFSIWGPHAIQETKGTQVIPELAPAPRDFVVRKRTYDPFYSTDLDLLLRQKGVQNLVITGTVANICVLHAAGSASLRGYQVVVPIDTISALNPFDFQAALRQISFVYQGKLSYSRGITFQKK
jgi:nicotinamidase-related amidase